MSCRLSWVAGPASSPAGLPALVTVGFCTHIYSMRVVDHALDLFLPSGCPVCGGDSGPHGAGVCGRCWPVLDAGLLPVAAPRHVDAAWALGVYSGPLGALVRRAKYAGDLRLADAIGTWMGQAARGLPGVDAVVPISAPWWRVLLRGHDVPPRLALGVAKAIGVPLDTSLRQRLRQTQVGQNRAGRIEMSKDRFFVRCAVSERILLLDDVQTTGSTLSAASAVLRGCGARWIATLTAVVRPWKSVKKSF